MPVDDKGSSSSIVTVTGETVQFFYSNAGVLTQDAGQAAGVLVVGQLAFNNVKNSLGNFEATKNDTSLSFTSTAFTSEVFLDWETFENMDETTFANRLATVCASFTNGQYTVDYSNGTIYGKKASTQTTLTSATYKYQSNVGVITPGTGATNLGKARDAVAGAADVGILGLAVANEAQTNLTGTDGDYTPVGVNRKGTVYTAETLAPVYEDNTLGKAVVEHRYTNGRVTADGQIKSGAGFIHKVTFAATGAVTAGVITIYDSLTETGTIIWSGTIQVALNPVTIHLNVPTGTGIYVGYDGTIANVSTTVAYR